MFSNFYFAINTFKINVVDVPLYYKQIAWIDIFTLYFLTYKFYTNKIIHEFYTKYLLLKEK